jgi:hypothetical protein
MLSQLAVAQEIPTEAELEKATPKPQSSPYVSQHFPNRVFWGDTHVHTSFSFDAGFLTTLGPEASYRFARGEEVTSSTGVHAKLSRPLDFLVVSDHAEYLGIVDLILKSDPLAGHQNGRRWHDMVKAGRRSARAVWEVSIASIKGEDLLKNDKIKRSVWERVIAAASKYYGGRFTTQRLRMDLLSGFNNLHRCVLFRDGPERVKQVLPFSTLDSSDPEDLWKYMASDEEKTGGQVLAIPHNGNMSNGRMFEGQSFLGKALTRAYAEERMRREPLLEITQTKGDGETHPFLSTDDDFANFEHWDFGSGSQAFPDEEMLQTGIRRSALKLGYSGRSWARNPFKFGMISGTSPLTFHQLGGNFFGKLPQDEQA